MKLVLYMLVFGLCLSKIQTEEIHSGENDEETCAEHGWRDEIVLVKHEAVESLPQPRWCWAVPPICVDYVEKEVIRWKNQTTRKCCSGFVQDNYQSHGESGIRCKPKLSANDDCPGCSTNNKNILGRLLNVENDGDFSFPSNDANKSIRITDPSILQDDFFYDYTIDNKIEVLFEIQTTESPILQSKEPIGESTTKSFSNVWLKTNSYLEFPDNSIGFYNELTGDDLSTEKVPSTSFSQLDPHIWMPIKDDNKELYLINIPDPNYFSNKIVPITNGNPYSTKSEADSIINIQENLLTSDDKASNKHGNCDFLFFVVLFNKSGTIIPEDVDRLNKSDVFRMIVIVNLEKGHASKPNLNYHQNGATETLVNWNDLFLNHSTGKSVPHGNETLCKVSVPESLKNKTNKFPFDPIKLLNKTKSSKDIIVILYTGDILNLEAAWNKTKKISDILSNDGSESHTTQSSVNNRNDQNTQVFTVESFSYNTIISDSYTKGSTQPEVKEIFFEKTTLPTYSTESVTVLPPPPNPVLTIKGDNRDIRYFEFVHPQDIKPVLRVDRNSDSLDGSIINKNPVNQRTPTNTPQYVKPAEVITHHEEGQVRPSNEPDRRVHSKDPFLQATNRDGENISNTSLSSNNVQQIFSTEGTSSPVDYRAIASGTGGNDGSSPAEEHFEDASKNVSVPRFFKSHDKCPAWHFGKRCLPCSCNTRRSHSCDAATGKCNCRNGWKGLRCQKRCRSERYDCEPLPPGDPAELESFEETRRNKLDEYKTIKSCVNKAPATNAVALMFLGSVCFVFFAIVLLIVLLKYRRKCNCKKTSEKASMQYYIPTSEV